MKRCTPFMAVVCSLAVFLSLGRATPAEIQIGGQVKRPLVKPESSHPVHLIALATVEKSLDVGAIQVEFARMGYRVYRTDPLEVAYEPKEFYVPSFRIQVYGNGTIAFIALALSHQPGQMAKELTEMFIEGGIREEFFSVLASSGEVSPSETNGLKEALGWEYYAMDEDTWALGRIYVSPGRGSDLSINTEEKPEYAWFAFNWAVGINGVRIKKPEGQNDSKDFRKGKNFVSLPLPAPASDEYCYFLMDGKAEITSSSQRLDVVYFESAFVGDLYRD